jgi:molybdenum cofactor guanylyltransferase
VLGGGRSSRMGMDKGLIVYHDIPQREHSWTILKTFCDKVYFSCKSAEGVPPELNPLPDAFELESPLNGILTATSHNPSVSWVTLPVDMPLVDIELIELLLQHRNRECYATCFVDSDGINPEPLLAIWEPSAYTPLLDYYNGGGISPRAFLQRSPIQLIHFPTPKLSTNINSPSELQDFRKKIH